MSTQENKAISNRVAEAIGKGDLNALDEFVAPELAEEVLLVLEPRSRPRRGV